MQKNCTECGVAFECQSESRGCWCEALPAVMPLAEGAQCLCPDCLKAKIEIVEAWDAVSQQYADRYSDEIRLKPFVQEFLPDFLANVQQEGLICDMGCGPGQVARYISQNFPERKNLCGIDLSPKMIEQASRLNPGITFEAKDVLTMPEKEIYDAIIGLYFIVNFPVDKLPLLFRKLHQLLKPGGNMVLSFHIGEDHLHREDNLWDSGKGLSFYFFQPRTVKAALEANGFIVDEVRERQHIDGVEYPTRRAYVFCRKI